MKYHVETRIRVHSTLGRRWDKLGYQFSRLLYHFDLTDMVAEAATSTNRSAAGIHRSTAEHSALQLLTASSVD